MSRDILEGKVGRMYVPRQEVDTMPLRKMKVSRSTPALAACCHDSRISLTRLCFECGACSARLGWLTGSLACCLMIILLSVMVKGSAKVETCAWHRK